MPFAAYICLPVLESSYSKVAMQLQLLAAFYLP